MALAKMQTAATMVAMLAAGVSHSDIQAEGEIPMTVYITSPHVVMPLEMQELWRTNAPLLEGAQVQYHNEKSMERGVKEISELLEKETDIHGAWDAFQNLRPGAFRADMWRTMMLWAKGGIYLDCDLELQVPITTWIKHTDSTLFLVKDCDNIKGKDGLSWAYWNAMMAAVPRNKILEHALRTIVHNVRTHYYAEELPAFRPLAITGPRALGMTLESYNGSIREMSQAAQLVVAKNEEGLDDPIVMLDNRTIVRHRRNQGLAKTYQQTSTHYDALYRLHLVYCDEGDLPCTAASQRYLAMEHGRLLRRLGNQSTDSLTVTNLSFVDMDLDALELGGEISWNPPTNATAVRNYSVCLAEDNSGTGSSQIQVIPVGTNIASLPADTATSSFTHVMVITQSDTVIGIAPAFADAIDASASVTSLDFPDLDLDATELGGAAAWSEPVDASQVTAYDVYLAQDHTGTARAQVPGAESSQAGTNQVSIPQDTQEGSFTHLLVYTRSSLAQQTTPTAITIQDTSSSVSSLVFFDDDLDAQELGGDVTWTAPTASARVAEYFVYLAEDASGANRAQVNTAVAVGTNQIAVPADRALASFSHVIVYTSSTLAQQTTPTAITIQDTSSSVSSVAFFDKDLDAQELGGDVTWTAPTASARVAEYFVYLAEDASGANRAVVNAAVAVGTNQKSVPADTALQRFSHVIVYTASSFAQQTTPTAVTIQDTSSSVSSVKFLDKDLDERELGGNIAWTAPTSSAMVDAYVIYLASAASGTGKSLVGSLALGEELILLPEDTAMGSYTHLLVYTQSTFCEQTTPAAVLLNDLSSRVVDPTFVDEDLDALEVGGTLKWDPAGDVDQVEMYAVYMANSISGSQRTLLGSLMPVGLNETTVPPGTALDFRHLLVYTRSDAFEQTTPAYVTVVDSSEILYIQTAPMDGARDAPLKDFSILLTFSEDVQAGSGEAMLQTGEGSSSDTVVELDCDSAPAYLGRHMILPIRTELQPSTLHRLEIPLSCVLGASGANLTANITACQFTTIAKGTSIYTYDFASPNVIAVSPASNVWVTGQSAPQFVLYFSEAVQTADSSLVRVLQTASDSANAVVYDASPGISIDEDFPGRVTVTQLSSARPATGAEYELHFDAGLFKDVAGNYVQDSHVSLATALSGAAYKVKVSTQWRRLYPSPGASTGVSPFTTIVLEFEDTVTEGAVLPGHQLAWPLSTTEQVNLCGDRALDGECQPSEKIRPDGMFFLGKHVIMNPPDLLDSGEQYNVSLPDSLIKYFKGFSSTSDGDWEYSFSVVPGNSAAADLPGLALVVGLVDCNGNDNLAVSGGASDACDTDGDGIDDFQELTGTVSADTAILTTAKFKLYFQEKVRLGSGQALLQADDDSSAILVSPVVGSGSEDCIVSLAPALQPGRGYTLSIPPGVVVSKSLAVVRQFAGTSFTFYTPLVLVDAYPANGSVQVARTTPIKFTFSTVVQPAALPVGSTVLDVMILDASGNIRRIPLTSRQARFIGMDLILVPDPPLLAGKVYEISLQPKALRHLASGHTLRFTTRAEDTVRPTIVHSHPHGTISKVSLDSTVPYVLFSEGVTPNTVKSITFKEQDVVKYSLPLSQTCNETSTACIEFDDSLESLVRLYPMGKTPEGNIAPWVTGGATYTVDVEAAAFSDAITTGPTLANPMNAISFSFVVDQDVFGPYIVSGVPAKGGTDIEPTRNSVFLTFNEVIQAGDHSIAVRSWDYHERGPGLISASGSMTTGVTKNAVVALVFDTAVQAGSGSFELLDIANLFDANDTVVDSISVSGATFVSNNVFMSFDIENTNNVSLDMAITNIINNIDQDHGDIDNGTNSMDITNSINSTNDTTCVQTSLVLEYYVRSAGTDTVLNAASQQLRLQEGVNTKANPIFFGSDVCAPHVLHSSLDDFVCMPSVMPDVELYLTKGVHIVNTSIVIQLVACAEGSIDCGSHTELWSLSASVSVTDNANLQVTIDNDKHYKVRLSTGSLPSVLPGSTSRPLAMGSKLRLLLGAGLLRNANPSISPSLTTELDLSVCEVKFDSTFMKLYSPDAFALSTVGPQKIQLEIPQGAIKDLLDNKPASSFTYSFTHDFVLPVFQPSASNPANQRVDVSAYENIVLSFNEVVQAGLGSFRIFAEATGANETVLAYEVDVADIVANSTHGHNLIFDHWVTITPRRLCTSALCAPLASDTTYHVETSGPGVLEDAVGNKLAHINAKVSPPWTFSTLTDSRAPAVVYAGGISMTGLEVTGFVYFSELVVRKLTDVSITIQDCGSDYVCQGDESGALTDATLTFGQGTASSHDDYGTMKYTKILPRSDRRYKIVVPAGLVKDSQSPGLAGPLQPYSFHIDVGTVPPLGSELVAPRVTTYFPANNAVHVSASTDIVLTFSEDVQKGQGTVQFCLNSDAELDGDPACIAGILAGGSPAVFNISHASIDRDVVTMDIQENLAVGQQLYVLIPSGAIMDVSPRSNAMAQLQRAQYTFRVTDADLLPPVLDYYALPKNGLGSITLFFNEAVQACEGKFSISRNAEAETGFTTSISGNTVQIVSTATWQGGLYALFMEGAAVQDLVGNRLEALIPENATDHFNSTIEFEIPDDLQAPNVSMVPTSDSSNVDRYDVFALQFSEVVQRGSGILSILMGDSSCTAQLALNAECTGASPLSDAVVSTLPLVTFVQSNAKVSVGVVDPLASLPVGRHYTLRVPPTAFSDEVGNAFAGFAGFLAYNVKTTLAKDTRMPVLLAAGIGAGGSPNPAFRASTIDLYFSEAVQLGSVSTGLRLVPSTGGSNCNGNGACLGFAANCSSPCNYTAASTALSLPVLSILGAHVTLGKIAGLEAGKGYKLALSAGTFSDLAGNPSVVVDGENDEAVYVLRANVLDNEGPSLISVSPSHGAAMVPMSTTISLTFSEVVQSGAGNIDVGHLTLPVSSCKFRGQEMTCKPPGTLEQNQFCSIKFLRDAVLDVHGNEALSSIDGVESSHSFTTIDLDYIAPLLASATFETAALDPILHTPNLAKGAVLTFAFSEVVQAGTGSIVIADCTPGNATSCYDGVTETTPDTPLYVDVGGTSANSFLAFNGTLVHVDKADLVQGHLYALRTHAIGVFVDAANQPLPIISSGFEFAVYPDDLVQPSVIKRIPETNTIGDGADVTLYFSEAVQSTSGAGKSLAMSDGFTYASIPVDSSDPSVGVVNFDGSVFMVNPSDSVGFTNTVTFAIGADVLEDLSGQAFAGISGAEYQFLMPPPCTSPPSTAGIQGFAYFDASNSTGQANCSQLDINQTVPHAGSCAFFCDPGWMAGGDFSCHKGVFLEASCARQHCSIAEFPGIVECDSVSTLPVMGALCNATCYAGYSYTASDLPDGGWNCTTESATPEAQPDFVPALPVCSKTSCGSFPFDNVTLYGAIVSYKDGTQLLGDEVNVSCEYGFRPSGAGVKFTCNPRINLPGYPEVEWQNAEIGLPAQAPCLLFGCPEPDSRPFGNITGSGNDVGDTRTLTCQGEYYVSGGTTVATCSWSTGKFEGMGYCVKETPLKDFTILMTFAETVQAGSGNVLVKSGSTTKVSISCQSMEYVSSYALLPILALLDPSTIHRLDVPSSCFKSSTGSLLTSGFDGYEFTTIKQGETLYTYDDRSPESLPVHASMSDSWVSKSAAFVLYFSEAVQQGDVSVVITQTTALSPTRVFDSSPSLTFDTRIPGKVNVKPREAFEEGAEYRLVVHQGAFKDVAGNYLEQEQTSLGLGASGYRLYVGTTMLLSGMPRRVFKDSYVVLEFEKPVKSAGGAIVLCSEWVRTNPCNASDLVSPSSMIFLGNKVLLNVSEAVPGSEYNVSIPSTVFSYFPGLMADDRGKWNYSFVIEPVTTTDSLAPQPVASLLDCNGDGDLHDTNMSTDKLVDTCDTDGDGIDDFVEITGSITAETPILPGASFKLYFNENVQLGQACATDGCNATLQDDLGSSPSRVPLKVQDNTVTIKPTMRHGALYSLVVEPGMITDQSPLMNTISYTSFSFYTPMLSPTMEPANGAIDVARTTTLKLTFADIPRIGLSNGIRHEISISDLQVNTVVQKIPLDDQDQVKFQGLQVVVFPQPPLEAGRMYRVHIPKHAIRYMTLDFASTFSTRAEDIVKPAILHSVPRGNVSMKGLERVAPYMLFSESIAAGKGKKIHIKDADTGIVQYAISADDTTCGTNGAKTDACVQMDDTTHSSVWLYPRGRTQTGAAAWATAGRRYIVELEAGAFTDAITTGPALANPMDASSFTFAVDADDLGPTIVSGIPDRDAPPDPTADSVFLTFNEKVQLGINTISIKFWDGSSIGPNLVAPSTSVVTSGVGMVVALTFDTAVQSGLGTFQLHSTSDDAAFGGAVQASAATFVSNMIIFSSPVDPPGSTGTYYLSSSAVTAVKGADSAVSLEAPLNTKSTLAFSASSSASLAVLHTSTAEYVCLQPFLPDVDLYLNSKISSVSSTKLISLSLCGTTCGSGQDTTLWSLRAAGTVAGTDEVQAEVHSSDQYKFTISGASLHSGLQGSSGASLLMGRRYRLSLEAELLQGALGAQHLSPVVNIEFTTCEIRYDVPPSPLVRIYSPRAFSTVPALGVRKFGVVLAANSVLDLLGNAQSMTTWRFGHDTVVPTFNAAESNPPGGASASATENIVLSFSEVVQAGQGSFKIWDLSDSSAPKFEVNVAKIVANSGGGHSLISGNKVSITPRTLCSGTPPCADLDVNKSYYVTSSGVGVLKDVTGNSLKQLDTKAIWTFTTVEDDRSPSVAFVGGTDINGMSITGYIFFTERVTIANNTLIVEDCGSDYVCSEAENLTSISTMSVTFGTGAVSDGSSEYGALIFSGTLPGNARYKITVPVDLVMDDQGLTGPSAPYVFTVDVGTPPTPALPPLGEDPGMAVRAGGFVPSIGSRQVPASTDIVLHFNEDVQKGAGIVRFCLNSDAELDGTPACVPALLADNGGPATFDIASATVERRAVTMNLPSALKNGQKLHLLMPGGLLKDASQGTRGMPKIEKAMYHFKLLEVDTTAPYMEYATVRAVTSGGISLFFSEAVQVTTGNVKIQKVLPLPETEEMVPITAVSGNVANISKEWLAGEKYTIRVAAGAFQDLAGNVYSEDKYKGHSLVLASEPNPTVSCNDSAIVSCDSELPEIVSLFPAAGLVEDLPEETDGIVVAVYFSEPVNVSGTQAVIRWGFPEVQASADPILIQGNGVSIAVPQAALRFQQAFILSVPADAISDAAGHFHPAFERTFVCGGRAAVTFQISGDTTSPLAAVVPAASAHGHDVLTIHFNEVVQQGNGKVAIYSHSGGCSDASCPDLTLEVELSALSLPMASFVTNGVQASMVSINPGMQLLAGRSYSMGVPANCFSDGAGNSYTGLQNLLTYSVTVPLLKDMVAPILQGVDLGKSPEPTFTGHSLVMYFSEVVQLGSSAVAVLLSPSNGGAHCSSDGSGACTPSAACTSSCGYTPASNSVELPSLTLQGATVTASIPALEKGKGYKLMIEAGKFRDVAGNAISAVDGEGTAAFVLQTPADAVGPVYVEGRPVDGEVEVATSNFVAITFNEIVQSGSGSITLGSYQMSSDSCHFSDVKMKCLSPLDFQQGSNISVTIPGNAVKDVAGNHASLVLDGKTSKLSFQTIDRDYTPPLMLSGAAGTSTAVSMSSERRLTAGSATPVSLASKGTVLVLSFSEIVQAGVGDLILADCSPGNPTLCYDGVSETIADSLSTFNISEFADSNLIFDGASVYIDPGDFTAGSLYSVQTSSDGVFVDAHGRAFGRLGVGGGFKLNVITEDSISPGLMFYMPGNNAISSVGTDITLYFSEAIQAGATGKKVSVSDGTSTLNIPVDNSNLVAGYISVHEHMASIQLGEEMAYDSVVSVVVDAGTFTDLSGNPFAGIGSGDYSFRTISFEFQEVLAHNESSPFSPRQGAIVWMVGRTMAVYGGKDASLQPQCYKDLWWSSDGSVWSEGPSPMSSNAGKTVPAAAHAPHAVDSSDCLWLLGGECNDDTGTIWRTCDGGLRWTPLQPPTVIPWGPATPTALPTAWDGHAIAIVGGWQLVIVDATRSASQGGGVWRAVDSNALFIQRVATAPLPFQERRSPRLLTTSDGLLYLFGGDQICNSGSCTQGLVFADVWASANGGETWNCQITDTDYPGARGLAQPFSAFIARDDRIFLMGGGTAGPDIGMSTVFTVHRLVDSSFNSVPHLGRWSSSDGSFTIYFSEGVQAGSGGMELLDYGQDNAAGGVDDTVVDFAATIAANALQFTATAGFVDGRRYRMELMSGAVSDYAGNPLATPGLSLEFTATKEASSQSVPADTTPPQLIDRYPAHEATATNQLSVSTGMFLTFDETIQAGAGQVTLAPARQGSLAPVVTISGSDVVLSGAVAFLPLQLLPGEEYKVTIPQGMFKDVSNNIYAGLTSGYTVSTAPLLQFKLARSSNWGTLLRTSMGAVVDPDNNIFVIGGKVSGDAVRNDVWKLATLRQTVCASSLLERTQCSFSECQAPSVGAAPTLGTTVLLKTIWRSPSAGGRRCFSELDGRAMSILGAIVGNRMETCPCPTCISPPAGVLPENMQDPAYLNSYIFTSAANGVVPLQCKSGYRASGDFICTRDSIFVGKFRTPFPTCLKSLCDAPPSTPGFARFIEQEQTDCTNISALTPLPHGGSCPFECGPGLRSTAAFECRFGVFTAETCAEQTCKLSTLPRGSLSCNSGGLVPAFGDNCSVICEAGYTPSIAEVTCGVTASENEAPPAILPALPSCSASQCGSFTLTGGGSVTYVGAQKGLGDLAVIKCPDTHVSTGSSGLRLVCRAKVNSPGHPEVEWQDETTLKPVLSSTCRPAVCPDPPTPKNGRLTGQGSAHGDMRTIECNADFRVAGGPAETTCSANTESFGVLGTCISANSSVAERAIVEASMDMDMAIPAGSSLEALSQDVAFMESLTQSVADALTSVGLSVSRDDIYDVALEKVAAGQGARRLRRGDKAVRNLQGNEKVKVSYKVRVANVGEATSISTTLADPETNKKFAGSFAETLTKNTGVEVSGVVASVPEVKVELIYLTTVKPFIMRQTTTLPPVIGDTEKSSDDGKGVIIACVVGGAAVVCCILGCMYLTLKLSPLLLNRESKMKLNKISDSSGYSLGGAKKGAPMSAVVPYGETTSSSDRQAWDPMASPREPIEVRNDLAPGDLAVASFDAYDDDDVRPAVGSAWR